MPSLRTAWPFVFAFLLTAAGLLLEAAWSRERAEQELVARVGARVSVFVAEGQRALAGFSLSDFDAPSIHNTFLLAGDSLVQWSDHDFLPDFGKISAAPDIQFVSSARSNFLALQKALDTRRRVVLVINLQNKYPISNRYLSTELVPELFPIKEGHLLPTDAIVGLPVTVGAQPLFRLAPLYLDAHAPGTLWLFSAASLLFLISVAVACKAIEARSRGAAFVFFGGSLIFIRGVQLLFEFPRLWVKSSLFDPQVYASSYLNFSLGDLLINSLLVVGIVAYGYSRWLPHVLAKKPALRAGGIGQIALFLLLCFAILFPYLFFESIYHNSQLTLDITDSLQLNGRRLAAWASVLAGLLAGWWVVLALVRILFRERVAALPSVVAFVLAFGLFMLYAFFERRSYEIPALLILITAGLGAVLARSLTFGVQWQFLVAVIFCAYAAAAIYFLGEERRNEYQQRFALNYVSARDELGEFLLHEVRAKIASDPFIISVWNNPLRNRAVIKDKITRVFLQNYFNQYEVAIQLFESAGENADATTDADLAFFLSAHNAQSRPTGYEGVFIRQAANLHSARNYRVITRVGRGQHLAGFVVVDLILKRAIPESVFPEVLLDEKRIQSGQFGVYSYAWWAGGQILNRFGTFDYGQLNLKTVKESKRFSESDYEHVAVAEEDDRLLVVSRPSYTFVFALANFCFFLLLGGMLLGVVAGIRQRREIYDWRNLLYAQRMQIVTLLAAALPFVMMAVTLFQLIRTTNREQLNAQFVQRARNLAEVLEEQPTGREGEAIADRVRQRTDLDFSIFDRNGYLLATNQPAVYDQQVLSRLLPPRVLSALRQASPLVREERIGTLGYKTCYMPVRDRENEIYAILSVPFFDFDRSNELSEIRTLNVLLILFVVVGLFAVALSVRLTRQLVSPLQWIAHTLSQTTFRQSPSPLEWKHKDELGVLVDAYNRMLNNWTEAKEKLSKQEKESAWREMAKQVAHEIKNPLTPMKLTLQQMQVLQARKDLSDRKVAESVASLLHQVELLDEIATSFSAFAGMPQPKLEKLEVGELLERVVSLYRDQSPGTVEIENYKAPAYVLADVKILSRAFSNILLNAWQSADRAVHVVIRVEQRPGSVVIVFSDNGPGIPEGQQANIFSPYFTTKKSGSGLGLAISRQGIELCHGTIRFQSTAGVGTTFEIELPAASAEANRA